MNAQAIIDRALRLTNTNSADYDPTQSVEDLNLVYQDMVDEIVSVTKGDYFWDKWETDTVVSQSEYVAEKLGISPDDLDIKKINKVFIKYSATDSYPTRAEYQNPWTLDKHPDWYKTNQTKANPFFYIQDNSIFLFPAPTEAVTDGLEIFVIHKPVDLTATSTEDEIEISAQFHKIMSDGMRQYIYLSQGKLNEANDAEQDYKEGIKAMTSFMKQRYNQPQKKTLTNFDNFR